MDEQQLIKARLDMLYQKQNEIIEKMNQVIERMNRIPRSIAEDRESLMRKAFYLETEIDRLKRKQRMPDEEF
jgi:hypothetical protein